MERRWRCPCTRWRDAGGAPVPGLCTGDADEAGALPGAAGYPLGVGEVESVVGDPPGGVDAGGEGRPVDVGVGGVALTWVA